MLRVIRVLFYSCFLLFLTIPIWAHEFHQRLGMGLSVDGVRLVGGEKGDSNINLMDGLFISYGVSPAITLAYELGYGSVRPRQAGSFFKFNPDAPFKTFLFNHQLSSIVYLPTTGKFHPYITAGTGLIQWDLRNIKTGGSLFKNGLIYGDRVYNSLIWNVTLMTGIGVQTFLTENIGLNFHIQYSQLLDQRDDNIGTDDVNNGLVQTGFSLAYYFFGWKDQDGDGISDKKDLAVFDPEDLDGFEDEDGIPDLDNDKDNVPDIKDQLPLVPEDLDGFQDDDGVPEPDNDWDGIADIYDKSPNEPEDFDGFEDEDGVPDLDNDQDGIPDLIDACPNEPENINGFEDYDGCPDNKPANLFSTGRNIILKGVNFELGSANLTEESSIILDEVFVSLNAHPEVSVEIRGYTDNTGSKESNMRLSEERAEAVKRYLIEKGIYQDRLVTKGFGPHQPIASNATMEGRSQNRRIEFYRIK